MMDRKTPTALLAAILAVTAAPIRAAETMPEPLLEAFRSGQAQVVFRVQWNALWNHPVVLAALEHEAGENPMARNPAGLLIRKLATGLAVAGLEPSVVEEAWLVEGGDLRGPWLRSGLTGDKLDVALRASGWQLEPGADESEVWFHEHPQETLKWQQQALEDTSDATQRAELAEAFDSSRPRLTRCGEHWLVASPYGLIAGVPTAACHETEVDPDQLPGFPHDVLFDQSHATLAAVSIDIAENDPPEEPDAEEPVEEQSERDRLLARLRVLQNADDRIVSQLGDLAITLSEVDGALILDVVARRPDGGGVQETARFLRMLVLGARFAVAPTAPALDREIGNTVIEELGDSVRASCTVSQASLIEIIEGDADRRREIRELRQRLEELDRER